MMIIVESGATKSDWCVLNGEGVQVARHKLHGTNVSSMKMEDVKNILSEGLRVSGAADGDSFYLYTAGVMTDSIREELTAYVLSLVKFAAVDIQNDLIGASRSVLGREKGVVAIMGTGSNACFYDGVTVSQKVFSGGFIIGDDGSASVLGKMFLADYIKHLIPEPVAHDFESKFDASYMSIVDNLYRGLSPAGYLGSLAPFVMSHYDDPYIKGMVKSNFRNFIERSLKCYDTGKYPVGIVGGFGYACRDIFTALCEESGIRTAGFVKEPIKGLIRYHFENYVRQG